MSATGRGGERRDADFYPTPPWCPRVLYNTWGRLFRRNDYRGVDPARVRMEPVEPWLEPCAGDLSIVRALPQLKWAPTNDLYNDAACHQMDAIEWLDQVPAGAIMTNPPYLDDMPLRIVEKAYERGLLPCILLLRLNIIASGKFAPAAEKRPGIFVLRPRPSFDGDGTDACEYAWFVWGDPQFTGTWAPLREPTDEERWMPTSPIRGSLFGRKL